MEQNLSERERKQRLAVGLAFGLSAVYMFVSGVDTAIVAVFVAGAAGFIVNYFTCFCGTKKLLKSFTG